jgi:hypothetical protein
MIVLYLFIEIMVFLCPNSRALSITVIPDGACRTGIHGFPAELFFLDSFRLPVNIAVSHGQFQVRVFLKTCRRDFSTQGASDTNPGHIKTARRVFRKFFRYIAHQPAISDSMNPLLHKE